jgi:hypothetical protein
MNKGTPIEQLPNVRMNIQPEQNEHEYNQSEYNEENEQNETEYETEGDEQQMEQREEYTDTEDDQQVQTKLTTQKPGFIRRVINKILSFSPILYQLILYGVILTCFFELYSYAYTLALLKVKPVGKYLEYIIKFGLSFCFAIMYMTSDYVYNLL